jgi:hypothetical protein
MQNHTQIKRRIWEKAWLQKRYNTINRISYPPIWRQFLILKIKNYYSLEGVGVLKINRREKNL